MTIAIGDATNNTSYDANNRHAGWLKERPLSPEEAFAVIAELRSHPLALMVNPGRRHEEVAALLPSRARQQAIFRKHGSRFHGWWIPALHETELGESAGMTATSIAHYAAIRFEARDIVAHRFDPRRDWDGEQ